MNEVKQVEVEQTNDEDVRELSVEEIEAVVGAFGVSENQLQ